MEYNFREIEKKWRQRWVENKTYKVVEDESKKKFYVLNMFPYPSGAGLHVGHPLGYIASDIYARYKRLQGFNVLNPMGYDAYGLPAEQYAIQTGQHPAVTTEANINRYREQLDKIGFCFDWDREVRTCEPKYYHWTQWAFQQMFGHFYCNACQKAMPISMLEERFAQKGTEGLDVACGEELHFTAEEWNAKSEKEQQEILMNYRIAYLGETMVNWCPALGTVLANDEVVDGVSERGGHPVVQKKMRQWCLRVSAYAQRLLDGLDNIDWTESLKETQKNWIGRSEGAEIQFKVKDSDIEFTIFTTRADTMYGVTFMVLAPESELVAQLTTAEQKEEVEAYLDRTKKTLETADSYIVSSEDITPTERVKVQATWQKYIDASISSTVNLPKETTVEDVKTIYMSAYDNGLKGITIFRAGCARTAILVDTKEAAKEEKHQIDPERGYIKRPKEIEADYHQVKIKGETFIVLVGKVDGKPYEVFAFRPNATAKIPNHTGTITKNKKIYQLMNLEKKILNPLIV